MNRKSHRIADRMELLDASGIRKVFDLAAKLENPINLSIGQPDFDVPENIKDAAIQAIRDGHNKYTQTQGAAALHDAIAEHCATEFGWADAHQRPYLVTSGVSGALTLIMETLVNPGDEVLFADPYFVSYVHLTNMMGAKPVAIDTYPDFKLTPETIEASITDKTRMMILNTPGNPTGSVYTEQELRDIATVCEKYDLLVIADEIYDVFCYDQKFVSIASMYNNTILVRGLSKSYAMTGWRVGWMTGPKPLIDKMTMLQQYTFVCAPSMAQVASVEALKTDMSAEVDAYRKKRDLVFDALSEKFGLVKPGGAFYAFVPAPEGYTGSEFVSKAIENNVLIIPGNVFSGRDTHFRISYATCVEKLQEGLDILNKLA